MQGRAHKPLYHGVSDLTEKPIIVSELLKFQRQERKLMLSLAGDREVTLVLRTLLSPSMKAERQLMATLEPRHKECLKFFHNRLSELRSKYLGTLQETQFPKPRFQSHAFYRRRGSSPSIASRKDQLHAEAMSGVGINGKLEDDPDEDAAHLRYKTFKESTYDSLTTLRKLFHYHFINAHGSVIEVQQRIIQELKYQSSLELDESTYDRISSIPLADKLSLHARQLLVHRLDSYEKFHSEIFDRVVRLIKSKFIPIVEKHSISGLAYINSEDSVFDDPLAIAILIDVFTERGFTAVVDIRRMEVPSRIDPEKL